MFADLEAQLTPGSVFQSSLRPGDVVGIADSAAPPGATLKEPLQRKVPVVIVSQFHLVIQFPTLLIPVPRSYCMIQKYYRFPVPRIHETIKF